MKNQRRRVSYAESLKAFKALEQRVLKRYSHVALARKRTALVGVLLKLTDQLAAGFSELATMPMPAGRDSTPAFLKADRPIATLRDFRAELLDMFCKGVSGADKDPEVAELRARLTKEPGPGSEIIAAGDLLVWFVKCYLFIQLQVEATSTSGLPSHDVDTHVEEAARAEISMAWKNQTLAHMKKAENEDDMRRDPRLVGASRKAIERRRQGIDKLMDAYWGGFQEVIEQEIRAVSSCCGDDSREARDLRALREGLHDRKDPRTRALFMQWLTVIEHLETAPPENVTLVQDGTASGPVDSSQRKRTRRRRQAGKSRPRARPLRTRAARIASSGSEGT